MKLAIGILGALATLTSTSAQAYVQLTLRARIQPQCLVVAVDAIAGSSDITVRTACNVEMFVLSVDEPDGANIAVASADNAAIAQNTDGSLGVYVENPGFQTVRIALDSPLGATPPSVTVHAA